MARPLPPTGFWSYTASDDASANHKLSQLRTMLRDELQLLIGQRPRVQIFQDQATIPHGTEWSEEINKALGESSFIIPVLTPGFLQSEWCSKEILRFRERERELGRADLIFPLHYVDTKDRRADDPDDCHDPEVLRLLRSRQHAMFYDLRLHDPTDQEVAKRIALLAASICAALRRDPTEPGVVRDGSDDSRPNAKDVRIAARPTETTAALATDDASARHRSSGAVDTPASATPTSHRAVLSRRTVAGGGAVVLAAAAATYSIGHRAWMQALWDSSASHTPDVPLLPAVSVAPPQRMILFQDEFNGPLDPTAWTYQHWAKIDNPSFYGRTQIRQGLPDVFNASAHLTLDPYDPTNPGIGFLGTEMLTTRTYLPDTFGIAFEVRAWLDQGTPGIVGGIYAYGLRGPDQHDEIDFELVTKPDSTGDYRLVTNLYANEPFGEGLPQYSFVPDLARLHIYRMEWYRDRVRWLIDGGLLRESRAHVPTQPMALHLNIWAPGPAWPEAYDGSLHPAATAAGSTSYRFAIDYVKIESVPDRS